jgi:hypothetical protein
MFEKQIKEKKNMKKQLLFICLILNCTVALKAQYVNLQISKLNVHFVNDTLRGSNSNIILQNNSSKQKVELFNSNNLTIKATYKINTNTGVRRSNLKNSAVNVYINYTFYYKDKKQKVKTERIFYLDDDKKFEEEQKAIFKEGINNKLIRIKYDCVLN